MNKDVLVNPHDIWMLFESGVAQSLGFNQTVDLYEGVHAPLSLHLGPHSGAPVSSINFRPVAEPEEGKEPITICPFAAPVVTEFVSEEKLEAFKLGKIEDPAEAKEILQKITNIEVLENGVPRFLCALHSAKPTICRAYPIGRAGSLAVEDAKDGKVAPMRYVQVPLTCGKPTVEWTVQKWVDHWGLEERYKGSDLYHELASFISANKDVLPQELRWNIANIIYNFDCWGAREFPASYETVIAAGHQMALGYLEGKTNGEQKEG